MLDQQDGTLGAFVLGRDGMFEGLDGLGDDRQRRLERMGIFFCGLTDGIRGFVQHADQSVELFGHPV